MRTQQLPRPTRRQSFFPIQRNKLKLPKWVLYAVVGICLILLLIVIIRPYLQKEEIRIRQKRSKNKNKNKRTVWFPVPTLPTTTTTVAPPQTTTNVATSPYPDYANPAYMDACYSMRVVVPTYTGPVVKIEKNDGSQQDIFTDATQSFLTTDPNNQGITMANWLSSQVGKVRVWYDQSGNNNHAACYNYCPTISTLDSSKYVLKFQQYTDSGLTMDNPVQPYAIFFQFWHDNNDPAKIISTDVDPAMDRYYGVVIQDGNVNGSQSQYDWYYVAEGDKDFTINQDDSPNYNLGKWNTVCLSVDNPDYSDNKKENLNLIGKDVSGYMSELILYNRPMSSDDMDVYNNNKFDVED